MRLFIILFETIKGVIANLGSARDSAGRAVMFFRGNPGEMPITLQMTVMIAVATMMLTIAVTTAEVAASPNSGGAATTLHSPETPSERHQNAKRQRYEKVRSIDRSG